VQFTPYRVPVGNRSEVLRVRLGLRKRDGRVCGHDRLEQLFCGLWFIEIWGISPCVGHCGLSNVGVNIGAGQGHG
jgi:hypothetical protein